MNIKFTILSGIILLSLGSIAYFSSKETSYTLLDASELAASPTKYENDLLRVRGFVKLGSVIREGKTAKFILEFNDKQIPVFLPEKPYFRMLLKKARVPGWTVI